MTFCSTFQSQKSAHFFVAPIFDIFSSRIAAAIFWGASFEAMLFGKYENFMTNSNNHRFSKS